MAVLSVLHASNCYVEDVRTVLKLIKAGLKALISTKYFAKILGNYLFWDDSAFAIAHTLL